MSCTGPNALNPACRVRDLAEQASNDAFANIAAWFSKAANEATNWLWKEIDTATTVNLDSAHLRTDLMATSAIAVVLSLGLFLIQIITSVLRREPGGLGRALHGLFISLVASAFALTATRVLLAAVDSLSDGVVRYAMDTNASGLGARLAIANLASINNPALVLLFSLVVLAAVVVVWGAMMVRKMMIIIAAVLTPLAFSGATADITRGWVRKWVEFMAAMIASKLLLVVILMIGVSVTEGAGLASHSGAGQELTQVATGALILLMGGFAPWVAIKMFHFAGDSLHSAHAVAAQAPSGARVALAAPQKVNKLHTQAHHTAGKFQRSPTASNGSQGGGALTEKGRPPGSQSANARQNAQLVKGATTATGAANPVVLTAAVATGAAMGAKSATNKAVDSVQKASPSEPTQWPDRPKPQ